MKKRQEKPIVKSRGATIRTVILIYLTSNCSCDLIHSLWWSNFQKQFRINEAQGTELPLTFPLNFA